MNLAFCEGYKRPKIWFKVISNVSQETQSKLIAFDFLKKVTFADS